VEEGLRRKEGNGQQMLSVEMIIEQRNTGAVIQNSL